MGEEVSSEKGAATGSATAHRRLHELAHTIEEYLADQRPRIVDVPPGVDIPLVVEPGALERIDAAIDELVGEFGEAEGE